MARPLLFPIWSFCIVFQLCSCKTQVLFEQSKDTPSQSDSLFLKVTSGNQYVIRKNDKLNISIWNNDDISVGSIYGIYNSDPGYGKWLLVDENGEIAIPRLGNLKVKGLTIIQLREMLRQKLSETIKQPIIDIKVLNKEVTILGQIKTPGQIHLEKENYTLTDIISMAGDFDLYSDKSKIQVIREINDTPRSIKVNLTTMKGFQNNNIQILPGDIVYVTPRKAQQWDKRAGSIIIPAASAITAMLLIFKTFF
jgi:polysaccharide export outer membrane protein